MTWFPLDTWIVLVGAACAVACALPGSFLVLRGMSLMGDAISHAVLPGLALAFLLTGSRASLPMFLGAAAIGILTAVLTQWIRRWGRLESGASMGIVFTTLFALGLVLIVRGADRVDLDPSCVLYGALEFTPLDTVSLPGLSVPVPRALVVLAGIALLNLLVLTAFFKEFRITSFDPEMADTLGIRSGLFHYLLMILTAVTVVAAFEAVGSVIVIALLIVPPATAHLLTDRLVPLLVLACLLGIASAALGHLLAITVPPLFGFADTSTAGMMAAATGLLFLAAWILAPRHGLLARGRRSGRKGSDRRAPKTHPEGPARRGA
jgi:manganese/zinc/iron transport system permease protein